MYKREKVNYREKGGADWLMNCDSFGRSMFGLWVPRSCWTALRGTVPSFTAGDWPMDAHWMN